MWATTEVTAQDCFDGGGYYIYNIADLDKPKLLVTLTGINGIRCGTTFTHLPDGRYVITETEYRYAPQRIFNLKLALDGEISNIRNPNGAWLAETWRITTRCTGSMGLYRDGLQVFSLMDPHNPVTVEPTTTRISALPIQTGIP